MKPELARDLIRAACLRRPELKYKGWPHVSESTLEREKTNQNPFRGFCYVATHAFCELVPEAVPYFTGV